MSHQQLCVPTVTQQCHPHQQTSAGNQEYTGIFMHAYVCVTVRVLVCVCVCVCVCMCKCVCVHTHVYT